MIKNENIICISSIDWDFIWQGHQEIMSTFAKNGNRVLFIENTGIRTPGLGDISRLRKRLTNWLRSTKGFRKEDKNLFVYSPMILPFPYSRIARWINKAMLLNPLKRWMKAMEFHDPIIWTFLPTGTAIDVVSGIDNKLLVYYCIADFYKLVNNPSKVKKTEDELIKKCDLIFAQGTILKEKCVRINKNVHIFPFGVNMDTFKNHTNELPTDMKDLKKPIIGYVGGVHRHVDFELIKFVANSNPDKSIVLVGPEQTNVASIRNLKNVFLVGKKDFGQLPNYIGNFDVCIIPYELNEYTQTVFPTKLNEYHAMGKPVVSTNLSEVVNFNLKNDNLVFIGKTKEEFNDCLLKALKSNNADVAKKRTVSAATNNWDDRVNQMSELIEKQIITKETNITSHWKGNFLKLYKVSRRKIASFVAVFGIIYLALFYTSLCWIIAKPLEISNKIQKADAIVVFAGGVGESGKAGQGYEERVEYAAKLYKEGYAKNLIFSSGYSYAFKEPEVMKALAISLDIPEKAIILEEAARNTVENVKNTTDILIKHNWNKILLVSSPYNMRRAFLVFKKTAKNVNVIYTPIRKSRFYAHPKRNEDGKRIWKRINVQQIKGIIHEYLGIIYYWFKGYI